LPDAAAAGVSLRKPIHELRELTRIEFRSRKFADASSLELFYRLDATSAGVIVFLNNEAMKEQSAVGAANL
jgi:hypothetical protein